MKDRYLCPLPYGLQMAFSFLVYPSLIIAYAGQTAFLIKNPSKLSTTFYSSTPEPLFWPMFIVASLAAIVASQALISASFSIIRQSIVLGCFPRVTMKHTSEKYEGQVYSPEVTYFLMIVCILITVGFKGGPEIGQAYGKQSGTCLYLYMLVLCVAFFLFFCSVYNAVLREAAVLNKIKC
jgi:KUP system potassium uptake protein